jgi:serine/threonine protein kinase
VLGLLGQGGMGMVYRARDRRLSREVALKFISVTDDQLRKRFLTEARAQARLNHEFICKVFEVGEVQGHPYIAMELVQGKPLSTIHRSLNREQKLTLVRDISHAVHTAHSLGIIHRDVKLPLVPSRNENRTGLGKRREKARGRSSIPVWMSICSMLVVSYRRKSKRRQGHHPAV